MIKKNTFIPLFLFTLMTLFSGQADLGAQPLEKDKRSGPEKIPVEVMAVGKKDISSSLGSTGTVEAYLDAVISAEVGGEVVAVLVEEGHRVENQDVLLKIDDYVLRLQEERGEANLTGNRSGYEYIQRIARLQTETRLIQAQAAARSAKAQYEHTKNVARTAVESRLNQARANRDVAASRLRQLKTGARPEEREQVQAARDSAKANYDNAKKNFERVQELLREEAISSKQYDDVKTSLEAAQARLKTTVEAWNLVDKGARVEDIEAAAASLEQAEAVLKLAEREFATESWQKDIVLTKSAWEQAEANVVLRAEELKQRAFEADIRRAEARFHDAEANLKIRQRQVARALIKAPFSGVVYDRRVELGETVAPGQPLIKVMQVDRVKISSSISETSAVHLSMGQKVFVSVDAYPEKSFSGEIIELSPAIEPSSRTMSIKVELDNSDNLLKPGMFARLEIELEKHEQVLVIPRDALIEKGKRRFVYLVENGRAVARDVELGLATREVWEVKKGLNQGDQVVLIGQSNLADGKEVTIVNR